jgi:hypothetical protein
MRTPVFLKLISRLERKSRNMSERVQIVYHKTCDAVWISNIVPKSKDNKRPVGKIDDVPQDNYWT